MTSEKMVEHAVTLSDLQKAEEIIISATQRKLTKASNYMSSSGDRNDSKYDKTPLAKLAPFVDDNGILRVGGRIRHADLSHSEKHPIILPSDDHITNLIVRHFHDSVSHPGRVITLGALRSAGFWLLGGQMEVSRVVESCYFCRRIRARPLTQRMADLPADRVTPSAPFTYVGLDVFGPWTICTRKLRGGSINSKRWALVLTCLVSRAIHVEIIESMDTSAFIMALRRFVAIRGSISLIRCDRGTNFVGAKRELTEAMQEMDQRRVTEYLKEQGCDWIFNPPSASHYGGVWERQILTIRRILDVMLCKLGRSSLTHELLVTFMAEVTGIVNSRPLTAITTDTDEPLPLTPAMLLTLKKRPIAPLPGVFISEDAYAKRRWRHVQLLANEFWNRWKSEYVQNLQPRKKWENAEQNLHEDDVVIIVDDDTPRYRWPLARVTEAICSEDGLVRKAVVTLFEDGVKKEFTRPISKLILVAPKQCQA